MIEPEFLDTDVVLFLHDRTLQDHGGVQGLKDEGLLGSALNRPANKHAYAAEGTLDLFDLAAAYAYGIAANHAFNDANKRTAWACCVLFLRVNGIRIDVPTTEAVAHMLALVVGESDEDAFAAWLRAHRRT